MNLKEFYIKWWWLFGVLLGIVWWMVYFIPLLRELSMYPIFYSFEQILMTFTFYLYLGVSLLLSWTIKTYLVKEESRIFVPTKRDVIIGLAWTLIFITWIGIRGHTQSRVQNIIWLPFAIWDIIFEKVFHPNADAFIVLFIPFLLLGILTSIYVVYITRMTFGKIRRGRN